MVYENLLAGFLGGVTSTVVLHPLDLLKIRFAVADGRSSIKKNYKSVLNGFKTIVKEEGCRGLYKGVVPNCLGSGSSWGLYFLFYNSFKARLIDPNQQSKDTLRLLTASGCAGVLTIALTNPIWVIKTQMCLQYGNDSTAGSVAQKYSGTWDALVKIYKFEGVRGLYRGFVPGLFGVTHGAIQVTLYEHLKNYFLDKDNSPGDNNLGTLEYLTCAATSKVLAATMTYPYQVVRARLQDQHVKYDGLLDLFRKTWRHESYAGFYKGYSAYILHVLPNVCIVFFVYESVNKYFQN